MILIQSLSLDANKYVQKPTSFFFFFIILYISGFCFSKYIKMFYHKDRWTSSACPWVTWNRKIKQNLLGALTSFLIDAS